MQDFEIIDGGLIKYCGNESHVIIPNSVTTIGYGAFYRCNNLKIIEIPNSVRGISGKAFHECSNLKSIDIPNSVTWIGPGAFGWCENLNSINIPNSVKYICCNAFAYCKSLKNVIIPNSATTIGENAFEEIKELKPQYNSNGSLRAFKGFNKDWTCMKFQYEVGKSYHQHGEIICCRNGFHACPNPLDVFNYYYGDLDDLRFAEVELSGEMDFEDDKVAASDIRIIRELTASELAEIYNSMKKN